MLQEMDPWFLAVSLSVFLCVALSFLLIYVPIRRSNGAGEKGMLPPSPPSLPVIGNLLWLRRNLVDIGPAVRRAAAEYGPVVTFKLGAFPAIFVASRELAHELLVVKGATYADRPVYPPNGAQYVYSSNGHIITTGSGALWRLLRRNLAAEVLHPARIRSYAPGRRWVLGKLLGHLRAMAEAGDGVVVLAEGFRNPMYSLLLYMLFGERLDEKVIKDIEVVQRTFLLMGFQLNVFDIMPRLAKLLLWKKWRAFLAIRHQQEALLIPLIRARRVQNEEREHGHQSVVSYVDTLLDLALPEEGGRKLDDKEIVSLCNEFFIVGVDSTASALQWVMANLVKSPDLQRKLFEEIRDAVGDDEKGEIREDDLQKMPYLKAVILEGLRRHPPAPMLLPHIAAEEGTLGGYLIPKGAAVNVAVAALGMDEKVWKDPTEFRPERFLPGGEGDGVDLTGSSEIKMIPFGAGRKICPGMGLAVLHLEYFVANLVREFEWTAVAGEDVDLSETVEFTVTMKSPLRARITPRRDLL